MTISIDWDNYELIEAEDYELPEVWDTIEEVREVMDYLSYSWKGIPEQLEDLLATLAELERELEDE